MSTQTLKPGDLCVLVHSIKYPERIGLECSIVGYSTDYPGQLQIEFSDIRRPPTGGFWTVRPEWLRLKRPPPDEFQPAEPEFVSDLLKRLNKVKA